MIVLCGLPIDERCATRSPDKTLLQSRSVKEGEECALIRQSDAEGVGGTDEKAGEDKRLRAGSQKGVQEALYRRTRAAAAILLRRA